MKRYMVGGRVYELKESEIEDILSTAEDGDD